MQYVGGKARSASWLRTTIEPLLKGQYAYLEPFFGGGNSFEALSSLCPERVVGDVDENVTALWWAVAKGWVPPTVVTPEEYQALKKSPVSPLRSFVGFGCSFGGKWFAGYSANKRGDDFCGASRRAVLRLAPLLSGVTIKRAHYRHWQPARGWLVYCDPPYAGTQGYGRSFDGLKFWDTCRKWACQGALVVVSEYHAPKDFVCIAERPRRKTLSKQDDNTDSVTERLFMYKTGETQ